MMQTIDVGAVLARMAAAEKKREARKQRRRTIEDVMAFAVGVVPAVLFLVAFLCGAAKRWLGI